MANSTVTAEVHQALDVHRDFAAQITLDGVAGNLVAHLVEFLLGEVLHGNIRTDSRIRADGPRMGSTDSENGRE